MNRKRCKSCELRRKKPKTEVSSAAPRFAVPAHALSCLLFAVATAPSGRTFITLQDNDVGGETETESAELLKKLFFSAALHPEPPHDVPEQGHTDEQECVQEQPEKEEEEEEEERFVAAPSGRRPDRAEGSVRGRSGHVGKAEKAPRLSWAGAEP